MSFHVRRSAALALLVLALPTCSRRDPAAYGTVRVAFADCREPQLSWMVAQIDTMDRLGPDYVLAQSSDVPDVTVRCADTGPTGGAEEYTIGVPEVIVDPSKAQGEFAIRGAMGHGLVHATIAMGRYPERTRFHVCATVFDEGPFCYAGTRDRDALMVRSLGGEPETAAMFREVYTGAIAQHQPVWSDFRYFDWATGRAAE